jgi:hypothetical protein
LPALIITHLLPALLVLAHLALLLFTPAIFALPLLALLVGVSLVIAGVIDAGLPPGFEVDCVG